MIVSGAHETIQRGVSRHDASCADPDHRDGSACRVDSTEHDKPDEALLERHLREFRDTLGQTGPAQDPQVTLYEVVAEA